jgi:peptidoglycan/xylan/chitin deacetylase (PgdA/CDA1 family)
MRSVVVAFCCVVGCAVPALAEPCPGNPDAIGTSRTITVEPSEFPRIGNIQYPNTLPLNDHEVVITLDDGPIPPYTTRILDTLASECVKVTYFLVGQMATAYPDLVRRIYNSGHTIGTHSQSHPFGFQHLSLQSVERQVDGGIVSVDAALGDPKALSPFFRIPGLGRTNAIEHFLESKKLVTWSADIDTNDWWRGTTPSQIVQRAMRRLNAKGRGILLMHDIHPATVMALPMLLKELKAKGYHIVQVVAAGERPESVPERPAAAVADANGGWPRVLKTSAQETERVVKTKHHRKRLARHPRDPEATVSVAKKRHTRTADISASVAKKRHKAHTAEQRQGSDSSVR